MGNFLSLVHVSDLHFADTLSNPQRTIQSWMPFPTGLETHDPRVLLPLSNSVLGETLQRTIAGAETQVVASGDLTTWGAAPAFQAAERFLRGTSSFPSPKTPCGLNDARTPAVPGNHDMWGGLLGGTSAHRLATVRARHFDPPVPSPVPVRYAASGHRFPYQMRLRGTSPAVYLYGLDSTQVDAFLPAQGPAYVRRDILKAVGWVEPQQLDDLQELTTQEVSAIPRVRIAMIHHPLAYPGTFNPPGVHADLRGLRNLDEVLTKFQDLGFALVLCRHQHTGFARAASASDHPTPPAWVLSVGTATQAFPRGSTQKNEYRIYDLSADADASYVDVTVNDYSYNQRYKRFVKNPPRIPPLHLRPTAGLYLP